MQQKGDCRMFSVCVLPKALDNICRPVVCSESFSRSVLFSRFLLVSLTREKAGIERRQGALVACPGLTASNYGSFVVKEMKKR